MAVDRREALTKYAHEIPAGWLWEWFTDVMDVDGGTQPPASTFSSQPRDGYVRLVQIRDFESDGHLTFIPDSKKWRKCRAFDVLIGRYGAALGRICTGLEGAYNVALAKIVTTERIHLPFAYHLLRSSYFQNPLIAGGGRSAQAGFNKEGLSVIRLPIPPLPEQRAIAHILGTLDDKIELNRRRNETLEAMARALFQDWFVDFGPVRAKMESREPYLPADLWQLFPDRLDADGKPEGWKHLSFGRLLEGTVGGDWGKEQAEDDHDHAICIIRGTDIPDLAAGFTGKVPTRYTTKKKLASRMLRDGDIVVEVSGGGPTQPTGRSLQVSGAMLERFRHPVVCASFCRRFRPMTAGFGVLAACHLTNLYRRGGTWEYQNQSTGIANFQTTHFLEAENVLVPTEKVLNAFVAFVEPILAKTANNESISLATLRDTLLPKLISGELRIKDAERMVERMV